MFLFDPVDHHVTRELNDDCGALHRYNRMHDSYIGTFVAIRLISR